LVKEAKEVRENAHALISDFRVGAADEDVSGTELNHCGVYS
jgi:cytidine deaminase